MRRISIAAVLAGAAVVASGVCWRRETVPLLASNIGLGKEVSAPVSRPVRSARATRVLTARSPLTRGDDREAELLNSLSPYQRRYVTAPLELLRRIGQSAETDGDIDLVARVTEQRKKLLEQALALSGAETKELQQ